jgi:hypothetical protein
MLARMWQNRNLGMQIPNHYGKQHGDSSKTRDRTVVYDPVIPLLGIYLKEHKTGYSRDTCTPMFITTLFIIAKLWKQPRRPKTEK